MRQDGMGRAKTVLIFGEEDRGKAVFSTVVAHADVGRKLDRIRFTGTVTFENSVIQHIHTVILPLVDRITDLLQLPSQNFEIAVVNLGVASISDIGLRITGFSADVPVFLAMLSAALQMPIPETVVSTGHLASPDGDIAMVRGLPAKLEAAVADPDMETIIYPAFAKDSSLAVLSPQEQQRTEEAIFQAQAEKKLRPAADIAELLKEVLSDKAIVLAGLQQGFFEIPTFKTSITNPINRTIQFLVENNEIRFWNVLEDILNAGDHAKTQELLNARMQFHIRKKIYPTGLGGKLLQTIQSLPPATRRLKIHFPLIPISECIRVSRFARESDQEDVFCLFDAVGGKRISQKTYMDGKSESAVGVITPLSGDLVNMVLSEINEQALAEKISIPVDNARLSFRLDSVTVESYDEFLENLTAFYRHLLGHIRSKSTPIDPQSITAEVLALLERAFHSHGGINAAYAEAQYAVQGGMRTILDGLTNQFKMEDQEKHIDRVLKQAIDPLDWEARVAFMKAFMDWLAPHLAPEIRNSPPERFARQWENLIRAYVRSFDQMQQVFRAL